MSQDILLITRALAFAARHHAHQRRKGADALPYINHLVETAHLLAEATGGGDAVVIAGGLLHDTLEDTDASREDLEAAFGREIADLVAEVSDDKSLHWSERKRLEEQTAPCKSPRARMIKLADKASNVRSLAYSRPVHWDDERVAEYLRWCGRVAAGCRGVNPALERVFAEAAREAGLALGLPAD